MSPEQEPNVPNPPGHPSGPQPTHAQLLSTMMMWLLVISSVLYFGSNLQERNEVSIPYTHFKSELRADNVAKIVQRDQTLLGEFRNEVEYGGADKRYANFTTILPSFDDRDLLPLLEQNGVELNVQEVSSPLWITILLNTAPWLILAGFFYYSSRMLRQNLGGKGAFGFGRSRARQHSAEGITTRFTDVAGLENAKRDLQEIIDFLREPDRYHRLGAKIPRGILMMGPPGCGKTLLARATAGEAGVPFFSVSGSEFIEMFVGVGASRVRDMFANAAKQAPSLIFIDEIDSVGRVRGTGLGGGNDEREQTLNQILAEMDGFTKEQTVVVIAATNRPDVLDPALLRPGRFDRKLVLELPGRKAREEIIRVHSREVPMTDDVDIVTIAAETVGFSGADLENLVNEAALRAARLGGDKVCHQDFELARDKVVLGNPSTEVLSGDEKIRVAWHEAGHALATLLSTNTDPLNKVSIVPRGRALGMTEQMPLEDRRNYSQSYLEEKISIMLGGRCAEQLKFDEISSGAADDLKQATLLARKMVSEWGMSERIGPVNLQQGEEHPFLGREMAEPRKFSEHSAQQVDEEISALIGRCEQTCTERLQSNFDNLSQLAQALLERETLDNEEVSELLSL
ncbi:MAG: ATP-dependent zinc metalloprotease FtsH [Arenicellales bacterium]